MTQAKANSLHQEQETVFDGRPDRPRADGAVARLALQLAHVPEDAFLTEYAFAAGKELKADHFFIARLNPFSNIMRSVRLVAAGELKENITYSLDGTPCARAVDGDTCIYRDKVAEEFPRDTLLKDMNVKGYVGAPLVSASGDTLGIAVALTKEPIGDEALARDIIEYFRRRVACALERSEILDRYSWAIAEASDGIWDWDVITGGTTISQRIQNMLGYDQGEGPYDLMQLDRAVHPDDRARQIEALHNHLNHGAPYDVKFRIRDRTGVYRWFRSRGRAIRNEEGKPVRMIGCFSDIHDLVIEAQRGQAQR